MDIKLQVYILCRDRPSYSLEAISSVLQSADERTEVIVSDNSEGEKIRALIEQNFSGVTYHRRFPTLPAIDHIRKVIEEASAEYLVIFHDDDRMLKDYTTDMLSLMESNPDVSAIGCNGKIINQDGTPTGREFIDPSQDVIQYIRESSQFLRPYLSMQTGAAPFPGYCYRRKFLNAYMFDPVHGGKHSDVTFLLKVLHSAPILWTRKALIEYRDHAANDSKSESVADRLSFLRYIFHYENVDRRSADVVAFKFRYWLAWWRQRQPRLAFFLIPRTRREKIVLKFLLNTAIKWAFTGTFFWKAFIRKILGKTRRGA